MIKKHQRWIALLVTISFVWLLQVSAMPLAAADIVEDTGSAAAEQAGQESAEQSPGFIEQQGPEWDHGRKKSPVRIIIIVIVGYVALSLLYLLIHGIDIDAAPREAARASAANRGRTMIR